MVRINEQIIQELKADLSVFQEEIKRHKKNFIQEKVFLFCEKEKFLFSESKEDQYKETSFEILIDTLNNIIYSLEEIIILVDNILHFLEKKEIRQAFFELKKFTEILEKNKANNNSIFKKFKKAENYLRKLSQVGEA